MAETGQKRQQKLFPPEPSLYGKGNMMSSGAPLERIALPFQTPEHWQLC